MWNDVTVTSHVWQEQEEDEWLDSSIVHVCTFRKYYTPDALALVLGIEQEAVHTE